MSNYYLVCMSNELEDPTPVMNGGYLKMFHSVVLAEEYAEDSAELVRRGYYVMSLHKAVFQESAKKTAEFELLYRQKGHGSIPEHWVVVYNIADLDFPSRHYAKSRESAIRFIEEKFGYPVAVAVSRGLL